MTVTKDMVQAWFDDPLREFEDAQIIVKTYMKSTRYAINVNDDNFTDEWIRGLINVMREEVAASSVVYQPPDFPWVWHMGGTFIGYDEEWLSFPWKPPYLVTWRNYRTGRASYTVSLEQLYYNGENSGTRGRSPV